MHICGERFFFLNGHVSQPGPLPPFFNQYGGDIERRGLMDANAAATADLLSCFAACF